MINEDSLVNNGLEGDAVCQNDGLTTWTYNQGVILGGLVDLYQIDGGIDLLARAQSIAQSTIQTLTADGILQELCEKDDSCIASDGNDDAEAFKGIFMHYLAYLHAYLNQLDAGTLADVKAATIPLLLDPDLQELNKPGYDTLAFYQDFITTNADSIWDNARNDSNQFDQKWGAPFVETSLPSQTSAFSALNAALQLETED
jgi:hypothetical protein